MEHLKLRDAIARMSSDRIKQLASVLPDLKLPTKKADRVEHLAGALESRLDELVAELNDLQRAALAHAVHDAWWAFDSVRFAAIHGALPSEGERSSGSYGLSRPGPTLLNLFFYNGQMPRDLGEQLRPLVAPVEAFTIDGTEEAPETLDRVDDLGRPIEPVRLRHQLSEPIALCEVSQALRVASSGGLRVTAKTRLPTAGALRAFADALCAPDWLADEEVWSNSELFDQRDKKVGPIRAHAWASMSSAGGFADTSKPKSRLTPKGEALLKRPPHEQIRELWDAWIGQDRYDEMNRVSAIKGQSARGVKLTPPSGRRSLVIEALRQAPRGQWFRTQMLLRAMIADQKLPEVALDGHYDLYVGDPNYGSVAYGPTIEILEGSYLRAFLLEYAATLGAIDVAYVSPDHIWGRWVGCWWAEDLAFLSPYDGVMFARITPLGAWLLGLTDRYDAPAPPDAALRVLPNMEVVSTGELTPSVRTTLDAWCTQSGERTWGISRASLLEAIDQDRALDDFAALLERSSPEPLPQTITALFEDVRRRSEALVDCGEMVVIEAASKAIALEIAHHRSTKSICELRGTKTILVPTKRARAFRRAVLRLGYTL